MVQESQTSSGSEATQELHEQTETDNDELYEFHTADMTMMHFTT